VSAALATPLQLVPKQDHASKLAAIEERLTARLTKFFATAAKAASLAVLKQTTPATKIVRKADNEPPDYELLASSAFQAIDWEPVVQEIEDDIEEAVEEGGLSGLAYIEVSDEDLFAEVNTIARDFARKRAAELVGMKYTADGELVANPDAQWAISETTREDLRDLIEAAFEREAPIADLVDEIKASSIFSEARAEMIAATEVQRAQILGSVEIWRESGIVETVIWQVSSLGPCDECADNADQEVDLGDAFPSGAQYPPAHPFCRCVLRPGKVNA